jgi:hypothetical protein
MTLEKHSGLMASISTETNMIGTNQTLQQSRVVIEACQHVVSKAQPNKLEI